MEHSVVIQLPAPLRKFAGIGHEVNVEARSVAEALECVRECHPALRSALFAETGELRPYVNVYVNRLDIRDRDGIQTPLERGDVVRIVPSIAGG